MTEVTQTYVTQGRDLTIVTRAKGQVLDELPVGVWRLCFHPQKGWWFAAIKNFELPSKMYGSISKTSQRILDTFEMRKEKGDAMGVLLSGIKGSGKTLLAKKVAVDSNLPVIVINQAHTSDDFKDIIANVGPCVVIFDEFEKVYEKKEEQNTVLTLLNGVFSNEALSFIIVNDSNKLVGPLLNRPGRLFYALEYGGLEEDFIIEYAKDRLIPEVSFMGAEPLDKKIKGILSVATMLREFTFDHLQAMVEEMNRYGESAKEVIKFLNVKLPKPGYFERFEVRIWKGTKEITHLQTPAFRTRKNSPLTNSFYVYYSTKKVEEGEEDDQSCFYISEANMTDLNLEDQTITFEDTSENVRVVYKKLTDPSSSSFEFINRV